MIISNVTYGLIPWGPANGQRAILIELNDDGYTDPNNILYNDLIEQIKTQNLESEWHGALNASQSVFLVFKGDAVSEPENFELFNELNILIQREAVAIQKKLIEEKKLPPNALKPPFIIWVGTPKYVSGKKQVYQLFNCLYPIIDPENPSYTDMAIAETLQHQYSKLIFICGKNTNFQLFNEFIDKFHLYSAFLIETRNESTQSQDFCLKHNFRFNQQGDSYKKLDLL